MPPIRVCVLGSSYEGSDSELKEYEGTLPQTAEYYFDAEKDSDFLFERVPIKKATAYAQIRQLVQSRHYDVFFNLCDGAKDEDRAGVEVVTALEEFHVPFTGATSKYYELSKPDMKMIARYGNIATAPFAVVEPGDDIREMCHFLKFPVIVKHISGYSSVGMDKGCKCMCIEGLIPKVQSFMETYGFALVEEFITGEETTVLACADATQPGGVRVFHPVKVEFPEGEDFKHFLLKWESYDGMAWHQVEADHPALESMMEVARRSFQTMMDSTGYGRVDLRIQEGTNEVIFLEINPNCGIMYPFGQEGSADWILRLTKDFKQKEFAKLQIREAIARCERMRPVYRRSFSPSKGYHLRAVKALPAGYIIFKDEGRPFRLCTLPYVRKHWTPEEYADFQTNAWPIGGGRHYYAIWDHEPFNWRSFNHSCDPNMSFGPEHSLNVVAVRNIAEGEELTMDYRAFIDETMPAFTCHCGSACCEGIITPSWAPRGTLPTRLPIKG